MADIATPTDPLASDAALAQVVRRLADAYRPERIYLFGSKARGDAGPDSDYDLMMLVPDDTTEDQLRDIRVHEVLSPLHFTADVLIWRFGAFMRRSRVIASLPATVLREGKLLYAA